MSIGIVTGTRARGRSHLGDRTAAFVDGQLSGAEAVAAARHLDHCHTCAAAVRAQRLLKWRMSGLAAAPVAPPDSLLGRLAEIGDRLGAPAAPAPAPALPVPRRRTVPRALVVGGLSMLAVTGAYAVAPGGTPTSTPPRAPAAPSVPASVASAPALPGTGGVVPAPSSGVVRAALAVEPAWSTTQVSAPSVVGSTSRPARRR